MIECLNTSCYEYHIIILNIVLFYSIKLPNIQNNVIKSLLHLSNKIEQEHREPLNFLYVLVLSYYLGVAVTWSSESL